MKMISLVERTLANPAAGSEFLFTVPAGEIWKVRSLIATLVTDANAANREVRFTVQDPGTGLSYYNIASGVTHIASQTRVYEFLGSAGYRSAGATALDVVCGIGEVWVPPGWDILILTLNLQAGDDWGIPRLLGEKWSG